MKIIKIILVVILILFVVAVGALYFYIKAFDINKYKPQIESELTKQLNRNVAIDKMGLDLSWKNGVTLVVDRITIADKKEIFNNDFLLKLKRLKGNVDIAQYVSNKRIVVTEVSVEDPLIYVVRTKEGLLNWQEVSKKDTPGVTQPATEPATAPPPAAQPPAAIPMTDFMVNNISVQNGQIFVQDASFTPPLNISVSNLMVNVKNFSLHRPFDFEIKARALSDVDNIVLKGQGAIELPQNTVSITNTTLDTNLANLNVDALNAILKTFSADYLKAPIKGSVKIAVNELTAGQSGLLSLNSAVNLIDGQVGLKMLEFPIENIDMQLTADQKDLTIHQLYMYLASGKVDMKGKVNNYMTQPSLKLSGQVDDAKIQELMPKDASPLKIEGKIDATFDVDAPQVTAFLATAKGEGNVDLQEGAIRDFNILKVVLEKISFIPNFYDTIYTNLPPKYKEILTNKDTVIQTLINQWKMENGLIVFDTHVETDGFIVDSSGQADAQLNAVMQGALGVSQDLSASMTTSVPQLSGLLNEKREIVFPLAPYNGPISQYKPFPDLETIGKRLIKEQGREELKKVIFKAIGVEETAPQDPNSPPPEADPNQPESQNTQQRPEELIINNVLDVIFK